MKKAVFWACPLLVVTLLGCLAQDPVDVDDLKIQLQEYQKGRQQTKLIYVEAVYEIQNDRSILLIRSVAISKGGLPFMRNEKELEGRVELLDDKKRSIWSMGYQPDGQTGWSLNNAGILPMNRFVLRIPYLPKSRWVRLVELKRGLSAESEIPSKVQ